MRVIWTVTTPMRVILALVVLMGCPGLASGQSRSPGPITSSLPPIGLPLPPIGLPLPAIGLPLPPIDLPPRPSPRIGDATPHKARGIRAPRGVTNIFVLPPYWWEFPRPGYVAATAAAEPVPSVPAATPTGLVRLAIEPFDAQLFVDGEFIGTVQDFAGELELEEGSHTLEIRARGYESQMFRLRIVPGRAISYTGSLVRTPAPEPTLPPPAQNPPTHETFYYIPGCYMGNVPPEKMNLPATCDLSRLITSKR